MPDKPFTFILRSPSEMRKHDLFLGQLCLGDNPDELYRTWANHGGSAHIYALPDGSLYARGDHAEKRFARGFICGWRRRGGFTE